MTGNDKRIRVPTPYGYTLSKQQIDLLIGLANDGLEALPAKDMRLQEHHFIKADVSIGPPAACPLEATVVALCTGKLEEERHAALKRRDQRAAEGIKKKMTRLKQHIPMCTCCLIIDLHLRGSTCRKMVLPRCVKDLVGCSSLEEVLQNGAGTA